MSHQGRPRSNAWFILPILLGIIGGIVAFIIIRRDDPKKAMNCLIVGIIFMGIGIIFNLIIGEPILTLDPGINVNV